MVKIFKLFKNRRNIHNICKKYDIRKYTINDDGSIDVNEKVYLSGQKLLELPLKFKNANDYFSCGDNQLTSLKGCPISVSGNFNCGSNQLTSLEGCPVSVSGNFNCGANNLTSLKGGPQNVGGYIDCRYNQINTLEGFTENLNGLFDCRYNPIHSLVGYWINSPNRHSMVDYFNDLDIIRNNGKVIILDRLEEFIDIFKVRINLKEVEKYYTVI